MDISAGLIVKGTLGAAAAASAGASYVYRDKIGEFISSFKSSSQNKETEKEHETINEKLVALGITADDCKFSDSDSSKSCELNNDALKKVAFTNKGNNDNTVANLDGDKKVSLKIEKGYGETDFPNKLRFTFKNSNDDSVEIGGNGNKITLKKDIGNDFKITTDGNKLESAWTLTTLGAKVGITCSDGDSVSECTLSTSNKINVWKSDEDYKTGGKADANKKINIAKDAAGYNGGYKFTVTSDTNINEGESKKTSGGISKFTASTATYEIDAKDKDGQKVWFLIEKSNGVTA